jgi:hypothetical protein
MKSARRRTVALDARLADNTLGAHRPLPLCDMAWADHQPLPGCEPAVGFTLGSAISLSQYRIANLASPRPNTHRGGGWLTSGTHDVGNLPRAAAISRPVGVRWCRQSLESTCQHNGVAYERGRLVKSS